MSNIEDLINDMEFDGIYSHIICEKCMAEVKENHPDTSPEEYSRLAIGYAYGGRIRVWCLRHKRIVTDHKLANGEEGGPILL